MERQLSVRVPKLIEKPAVNSMEKKLVSKISFFFSFSFSFLCNLFPKVVLINGFGALMAMWMKLVDALLSIPQNNYSILIYNHRGTSHFIQSYHLNKSSHKHFLFLTYQL